MLKIGFWTKYILYYGINCTHIKVPSPHHRTPRESPVLQTSSVQPSKFETAESNDDCQRDSDTFSSSIMPSDGKSTADPAAFQASKVALEVGDPKSTTNNSVHSSPSTVPVRHNSVDVFNNRQANDESNTSIPESPDQQKTAGCVQESETSVDQSTKEECSDDINCPDQETYIQHPPSNGSIVTTSDDHEKQMTSVNCKTELVLADTKTEGLSQSNTSKSDIAITAQEPVLRLPIDKLQTSPEVRATTMKTERPPKSIPGAHSKTPEVPVTQKKAEIPKPDASGNLSSLSELRLGLDLVPDFRARLGCGVQGSVYMAKLEPSGQSCVLKHFKLKNQCLREANVLHKMNGSPYFPEMYGTTRNGCIAMEFLGNYNVADALETVSLQPTDWLEVGLNVATGLQELHSAVLIHGDLKPENVMVYQNRTSKWQAKIIDLGMAEPISPPPVPYQLTPEQINYCTEMCTHLAPEILDCTKGVSIKGDIFSLGVVLYTIGDEAGIVPLQNWAMHCLDPDPASRPDIKWLISMITKLKNKWATQ